MVVDNFRQKYFVGYELEREVQASLTSDNFEFVSDEFFLFKETQVDGMGYVNGPVFLCCEFLEVSIERSSKIYDFRGTGPDHGFYLVDV